MSAYINAADYLRKRYRATVVIIHHCGVEGSRPRGHTSLPGAVDAQIAVSRESDGQICAKMEMMKDGPEGETILSRLKTVQLCTDRNGTEISSCIIVPDDDADAAAQPKRKKLSSAARLALRLFDNAMAVEGKQASPQPHVPPGVFCITEELWRDYCYKGGISAGGESAKQKAFYRSAKDLIDGFYIAKWGELLWRTHLY
jgi:hypothetical protein